MQKNRALRRFALVSFVAGLALLAPPAFCADCNGSNSDDETDVRVGRSEDCNNNGIPDECEQTIIRLGSDGSFAELARIPSKFVAGDLDGDGNRDIVAVTSTRRSSVIAVYLHSIAEDGSRRGEIAEPLNATVSSSIKAVDLGDVDGDGNVDVAVATPSSVEIRTGDGTGALSEGETIPLELPAIDVSLVDINGDGNLDLVVSHETEDGSMRVSVRVQRAPGVRPPDGGSFHSPAVIISDAQPLTVDAADMDGDGDLDIVTANITRSAAVFFNENCGADADTPGATPCSFSSETVIPLTQAPVDAAVADFDGDGAVDIVVASNAKVVVLRNNGDGRSFETASFSVPTSSLDVGDMDSDGDIDIVSGATRAQSLAILVNDGHGRFQSNVDVEIGGELRLFVPGDFDGDQRVDLAVLSSQQTLTFLWNGTAQPIAFDSTTLHFRNATPHAAALADFDGDGDVDFITGNGDRDTVTLFLNRGAGRFVATPDQLVSVDISTGIYRMDRADFDRDGDVDIVVTPNLSGMMSARIHWNDGGGMFALRPQLIRSIVRPTDVVVAELNGDDWPDLVAIARDGTRLRVAVSLNDGSGMLQEATHLSAGESLRNSAPADFDGDGDTDIAVANSTSNTISVLRNRGDGSFEPKMEIDAGRSPSIVIAGDWNRDGAIDLAVGVADDMSVGVILNRGDGSFRPARFFPFGVRPVSLATGDMNGDGKLDIVTGGGDQMSVLLNDDGESFLLAGHFKAGMQARAVVVGDVTEDGALDVFTANRGNGTATVFLQRPTPVATDYSELLCTFRDFAALSVSSRGGAPDEERMSVKFTVPARDDPSLIPTVLQNTKRFPLHHEFLRSAFGEQFPGLTARGLIGLTQVRATRDYFIGAVERVRTERGFLYLYSVVTGAGRDDVLTVEEVRWVHERLSEALTLRPLEYAPDPLGENPLAREAAVSWDEPGFPIFLGTVDLDVEFIPYTQGVGYGRVRLFRGDAFDEANESGRFTFQDIVVVDHSPRDIEGVVGGVITATPQGALSHVAVRTARRGTPNAFVDKAMLLFEELEGKLVRFEVTESAYAIEETTLEDAEAFWAERPSLPPQPFDAEYRGLDAFEEMDLSSAARFGGKATGLARLQTILTGPYEEYRERGFGIPMAYYLDFMRENTIASTVDGRQLSYEGYLEELFELGEFSTDSEFRFKALDDFRDFARQNGTIPDGLVEAIAARIEAVFGSRELMVRHRSSSNVEDILDFNGAGLYESTSVCVEDTFDEDEVGPSLCDSTRDVERTIDRALKKVWTSLWTFRAHEERSFFQIPQSSVTMGILVNRAFLSEDANGVAFTGDPLNPRGGCYIVTAQKGEESVVSPTPGVLSEVDILEVADGEVVTIVRSQRSTLVGEGEVILSDDKLRELGTLMWYIDENYPLDTEGRPRESVLLDMEFKLEPDGSLAVKQIRPFVVPGELSVRPTFELVIPEGAEACGTMNLSGPSGDPRSEYESKSVVRFRPGTYELPSSRCVFAAELFDEVIVGPGQELATSEGPGIFRVSESHDATRSRVLYNFTYRQKLSLPDGRAFEINLFNLKFVADDGVAVEDTRVLDEEFLTFGVAMQGFGEDPPLAVTYSSCAYSELPLWDLGFDLDDGTSFRLLERFLASENVAATGPGALVSAEGTIGGEERRVRSYWDLVYSAARHNVSVRYWVFLDPPASVPGVEGDVHVIQLDAADPPEVLPFVETPQEPAAAYLDENFDVIARPSVLSFRKEGAVALFRRGDATSDGTVNITDAIRTVDILYRQGRPPRCVKAVDANDDGALSVSDAVWMLQYLFGGRPLPEPSGACGVDPSADRLACEVSVCF